MIEVEAGIVSNDAGRLAAFYVAAFGFGVDDVLRLPQGEVHKLVNQTARLKIYQPAAGARTPPRPDPWFRDCGFAYAAMHVDDAEAVAAAAAQHGATILTAVTSHRPGARFALISDPEGNVWELLQES